MSRRLFLSVWVFIGECLDFPCPVQDGVCVRARVPPTAPPSVCMSRRQTCVYSTVRCFPAPVCAAHSVPVCVVTCVPVRRRARVGGGGRGPSALRSARPEGAKDGRLQRDEPDGPETPFPESLRRPRRPPFQP